MPLSGDSAPIPPVVFFKTEKDHMSMIMGWPLVADDWDAPMLVFGQRGIV